MIFKNITATATATDTATSLDSSESLPSESMSPLSAMSPRVIPLSYPIRKQEEGEVEE